MKIKKKNIIIFAVLVLFISSQVLTKEANNLDEMWNFNFANCIANGLVPYKDFNIILGSLLPFICSIFLKIFGQEMIVLRFLAIALDSTILFLIYKIMDKLNIKELIKYPILLILSYIMIPYYTIDYNWALLLVTLIIVYLEITLKPSNKKDIIVGLIAGLTITLKQTTGLVIVIATIGYKILEIRNKEDIIKFIKSASIRLISAVIFPAIMFIILIFLGAFKDYIDYCILGVRTFSNKITYLEGLLKNKNILIQILAVTPIFEYIGLIYLYIKQQKQEVLTILIFGIAQSIVVYPISDATHFVVAIPVILIGIGYILEEILMQIKININGTIKVLVKSIFESGIIVIVLIYFGYGIIEYKSQNINLRLEHFKYLPISIQSIGNVEEVDNFIESQEKKVYILDAVAVLYMVPINRYNKNYDMFNIGNLGSKGEERTN